jgi:hypothetical protein
MSADGNERGGVKAPRTLFSLGRPGAKATTSDEGAERGGAIDTAEAPEDHLAGDEIQYACGACGALLPSGASFCGECGTPVALDDDFADDGMLDELADMDAEPAPESEADAPIDAMAADAAPSDAPPAELADAGAPVADVSAEDPIGDPALEGDPATTNELPAEALAAGAGLAAGAWGASTFSPAGPVPVGDAPVADAPVADAPIGDEPVTGAPVTDAPIADVPVGDVPVADAPITGGPVADAPVIAAPFGSPPAADAPVSSGYTAPAEPAAVLYADPSIAEPLPSTPPGSFTVSDPLTGTAADVAPAHDPTGVAPAMAGAAVGGAAVGGADTGFEGTTAASMPYGTGPVESSAASGRGPLIAAVVVVGLLLIGAIAFALTRSGGSSDVATQSSTTQAPITTAKAGAPKGSGTTVTTTASTTTSTPDTTATDATDTDPSTTDTDATPSTDVTPTTAASTSSVTPSTSPSTLASPSTNTSATTPGKGVLSFNGPADFGIIGKGKSVSFGVTNVGTGIGTFTCSANDLNLNPSAGSVSPGETVKVLVTDIRSVEARYTISCISGSSSYHAVVTVGSN